MNILLVEDNEGDRDLLLEAFRNVFPEARITVIDDGDHALAVIKKDHASFDLLILDLNLPKKDGLEILKQLRIDKGIKLLPIVVLTTSRWQADHDASRLLEADASFVKPPLFPDYIHLVKSIRDVVNKKVKSCDERN